MVFLIYRFFYDRWFFDVFTFVYCFCLGKGAGNEENNHHYSHMPANRLLLRAHEMGRVIKIARIWEYLSIFSDSVTNP